MNNKIVLIDDNFAIRQVIKIFLTRISRKFRYPLNIFSTDNGVEGLGYVYITNPSIVIVDTTLPKYSGREVLDYFVQNTKFQELDTHVIVLHEDNSTDLKLPQNFHIITKNKKGSFKEITQLLDKIFEINDSGKSKKLINTLGDFILSNANKDDLLLKSINKSSYPQAIFNKLRWIWLELNSSVVLTLMLLLFGKPNEENITQQDLDKKAFRSKYYPTIALTFVSLIIILINFGLFATSQLPLFNSMQKDTTALSTFIVDSTLDSGDFSIGDGYCDIDDSIGDGPCTLRAAIEEANSIPGEDYIDFNISGSGPFTINLSQNLPQIISPIIIDGSSQSSASCEDWDLEVEISGNDLYEGFTLNTAAGNSRIQGLVMNNMLNHSVYAEEITNLEILCNIFDFEPDGVTSLPSDSRAIQLVDAIGTIQIGDTSTGGNLIGSREDKRSIEVLQVDSSSSPTINIENNYIGVEKSGQNAPENLSGMSHIYISGDEINASHPIVNIGGANTLDGGNCSGSCNIIACTTGQTPAIDLLKSGSTTLQGNYLGVTIDGENSLTYLGESSCEENAPGSGGINISEPYGDVLIGGDLSSQRNIISGFGYYGFSYDDAETRVNLSVVNNHFGTDVNSEVTLPNGASNFRFYDGKALIRNNVFAQVNILGDIRNAGIVIESTNDLSEIDLYGNFIGTDSTLTSNLASYGNIGISVLSPNYGRVQIGSQEQNPNYIKYHNVGIEIDQSHAPVNIINNEIIENGTYGIYFYRSWGTPEYSNIDNNLIKNTQGNEGSDGYGFASYNSSNIHITNNLFCSDDPNAQNFDLPTAAFFENGNTGILLDGNSLQSQYTEGFVVPWSDTNISIINSNFHILPQPGVDLGLSPGQGHTPNDIGDIDTGPNNYQNFPEITSVDDETINYSLDTHAGNYLVEFHVPNADPVCGQGNSLICNTTISHNGNGSQDFSFNCPELPERPYDIATITTKILGEEQYGDTSELSPIFEVSNPEPSPTPTSQPTPTPVAPTVTITPNPTTTQQSPSPTSILVTPTTTPEVSLPINTKIPSVTPSEMTEVSITPTSPSTPTNSGPFGDFSPDSSYALPDDSLLNHPLVKSDLKEFLNSFKNNLDTSKISSKLLNTGLNITKHSRPVVENLSYLLSLQFIGERSAKVGIAGLNLITITTPTILYFIAEPKIFYYAFIWIWRKKKSPTWGVIVDKTTKLPIAFARVILTQDGKTIASYTTDLQGRYGMDSREGRYKVFVIHSEYIEESKEIEVKSDKDIIVLDFELTPKLKGDFHRTVAWWIYIAKKILRQNLFVINTIVFSTGFIYTLFAVTNSFTVLNYSILMLYIIQILMIIIFSLMKEKNLGQVIDLKTNQPVQGAIIRLFDNQKQLDVTITDNQGRYSFIVEPGTYYIKVNAGGYTFPVKDSPNIITNKAGEKLLKITTHNTEKISLKLYVQGYSSYKANNFSILSPFN